MAVTTEDATIHDPVEFGEVVVGIDGSSVAEDALRWAAHEATLRATRLVIAHAQNLDSKAVDEGSGRSDVARSLIVDAEAEVFESEDDCAVRTVISAASPTRLLRRLADGAQLLVVGCHGRAPLTNAALGSVAAHLAERARCPVVVLPASVGRRRGALTTGSIVVGLDDTAAGRRALRAGFAESTLRRRPLLLVRSWEPVDFTGALLHPRDGRDRLSAAQRDAYLEGLLAPLRVEFPSVEVTARETWDSVPDSLLNADPEAQTHRDRSTCRCRQ